MNPQRPPASARRTAPSSAHPGEPHGHDPDGGLPLGTRRAIAVAVVLLAVVSSLLGATRSDADESARSAPRPTPSTSSPSRSGRSSPASDRPSAAASSAAKPQPKAAAAAKPTVAAQPKSSTQPAAVPQRGNGRLLPVLVPGADTPGKARAVTYSLEVEDGLGVDTASVGRQMAAILRHPKGWQTQDSIRFVQVTPAQRAKGVRPTMTLSLVSAEKTDQMCAPLNTEKTWSCANKDHAVLNYTRWALATPTYKGALSAYRVYQVNHEVGHELGHGHRTCPPAPAAAKGKPTVGALAPVMMQQSMGLGGCRPNAFPTQSRG